MSILILFVFDCDDLLGLDVLLFSDEIVVCDIVRWFCVEYVILYVVVWFEDGDLLVVCDLVK